MNNLNPAEYCCVVLLREWRGHARGNRLRVPQSLAAAMVGSGFAKYEKAVMTETKDVPATAENKMMQNPPARKRAQAQ